MSPTNFHVKEHVIPCAHIREYPRATKIAQEDILKLAIKQYIPHDPVESNELAITIVAGHANGLTKELYEPLWDDLYMSLKSHGIKIRGIWAADSSHQGASGILNEHVQGDDPSWFDHSRDLLSMVNTFRAEMPRPIIGFGHSFSCVQIAFLSIMHPRLFTNLILIEPVILREPLESFNAHLTTTMRPDTWESQEAAQRALLSKRMYKAWDPRVVDLFFRYCLRPLPTALYPHAPKATSTLGKPVTLTTTKQQEAWTYTRTNFIFQNLTPLRRQNLNFPTSSDENPSAEGASHFHCPAPSTMMEYLPFIRPSVYYIYGEKSYLFIPDLMAQLMSETGIARGGSGGEKAGNVKISSHKNHSHLVCFENPSKLASDIAEYLEQELRIFQRTGQFYREHDPLKSSNNMLEFSQKWIEMVQKPLATRRTQRRERL